jgi:hypothetical protein
LAGQKEPKTVVLIALQPQNEQYRQSPVLPLFKTFKAGVAGSSPARPTVFMRFFGVFLFCFFG